MNIQPPSPFDDGVAAREFNIGRHANPYPQGTLIANEWERGWKSADDRCAEAIKDRLALKQERRPKAEE